MHIVLLNQAFYPDVVATAQMAKDLADTLSARGHTVTAIASRSIYGKQGASLPARETIRVGTGTIDIHRVGWSLFGKSGVAARVADFALFYALAMVKSLTIRRPDVIVSFTTPPFIGLVGVVCSWLRGSAPVCWVMDLYPDVAVACGVMKPRSLLTRAFDRLGTLILQRSRVNVVLGRCMEKRVLGKGVDGSRVRLIPVWADLDGLEPVEPGDNEFRRHWAPGAEFIVMYSGNFGLGHDADTLMGAMKELRNEPGLRFVFVGGGKRRREIEGFVREQGITNATWDEYQPREKLGASLSAGDVHLLSVREGVEGMVVPSKMFGIMAVGRPAIYIGHPDSEVARVIAESDGGVLVREGDVPGLVKAIRDLRADAGARARMGASARRAIAGRFDRETACRAWADLLEGLGVAGSPSPVKAGGAGGR